MRSITRIEIKFIIWMTVRDKIIFFVIQWFDQGAKTWLRNEKPLQMLQKYPICMDLKMEMEHILVHLNFEKELIWKLMPFF
jgi:hypothetical protein